MLTGFNTDVRHGTVVLHVQTEDKGEANPLIESLVYLGGQILDRERSHYQELLDNGHGTEAVVKLMERQHRHVIERIRGGHLDARLVSMGVMEGPAEEAEELPEPDPDPTPTAPQPRLEVSDLLPAPVLEAATEVDPEVDSEADSEADSGADPGEPPAAEEPEPMVEASPAGEIAFEENGSGDPAPVFGADDGPTLDQVILDYLSAEADEERLVLVMDTHGDLRPGREAVLRFQTRTSLADEPVAAADVRVRMITTSTEPMGLGRGETDAAGRLELKVRIPELAGGAAALIVNARSRIGDAELKHLI